RPLPGPRRGRPRSPAAGTRRAPLRASHATVECQSRRAVYSGVPVPSAASTARRGTSGARAMHAYLPGTMSQLAKKTEVEKRPFVSDIKEIRRRAREHILKGAVTDGYRADRQTVIRVLNEALATEIVCTLRYRRHYFMASGIHAQA